MNIRNQKAINRLSRKSFFASKKQNLITFFAIVLTTLLFTSLFTVFLSMKNTFHLQELKNSGYSAHGIVMCADDEEVEKVRTYKNIKKSGRSVEVGFFKDNKRISLAYVDDNAAEFTFSTPVEGKLPSKENEIVLSKELLKMANIEPKIGSEVKPGLEIVTKRGEFTLDDTFILSGIASDDASTICVSEAYAQKLVDALGLEKVEYLNMYFQFGSDKHVLGSCMQMADDLDLDAANVLNNYVFESDSNPIGEEGVVAIAVFVILIMLSGFFIIYNIFQITVGNKIRYYGLLKTIGVTSRQLRKIMYRENLALCLTSIPFGLLIGYFVGNALVPIVIANTAYRSIEILSGFSPLVMIGASLFSIMTVFISSFIPVRKASKVSPIEALRFNDAKVSAKPHKSNRANVTNMAISNLGRNKTRTVMVLLSLSLALVVFESTCLLTSSLDANNYVQQCSPEMDFIVSTDECFMGDNGKYLSDSEIDKIASNIDSKICGKSYISDMSTVIDGSFDTMALVIAADESLSSQFDVKSGDIDPMYEEGSKQVIAPEGFGLKVGDKVNVQVVEDVTYKNKKTGEKVLQKDINEENYDQYEMVIEGKSCEYTICAIVDKVPDSFSAKFAYGEDYKSLVFSKEQLEDLTGDVHNLFFCADAADSKAYDEAEAYLSGLDSIEYSSAATIRAEFDKLVSTIKLIGSVLCSILAVIGILNFINAILTSIIARKHELALLNAVGMTFSQIRKMLITEGLFYSVLTILLALPGSAVMSFLIGNVDFYLLAPDRHFIIWPLLLMIPVFALLSFIVPTSLYGRIRGASIVDDLRTNE